MITNVYSTIIESAKVATTGKLGFLHFFADHLSQTKV